MSHRRLSNLAKVRASPHRNSEECGLELYHSEGGILISCRGDCSFGSRTDPRLFASIHRGICPDCGERLVVFDSDTFGCYGCYNYHFFVPEADLVASWKRELEAEHWQLSPYQVMISSYSGVCPYCLDPMVAIGLGDEYGMSCPMCGYSMHCGGD